LFATGCNGPGMGITGSLRSSGLQSFGELGLFAGVSCFAVDRV
jgi:hypothetical protein